MIRLPIGRRTLAALAILAALLATLPARAVLGWAGVGRAGLAARAADGSVWAGRLTEAQIAGVPLGDLDMRLRMLPLLLGRAHLDLGAPDRTAEGALSGALIVGRHLAALDATSGRVTVAGRLAPLPVTAVELEALTVRIEDGLCVGASGRVRATLAGTLGGIVLPAGLSGEARCEAGRLTLPLASQAGGEMLALSFAGDGRYRASLILAAADPQARDRLLASGFVPSGSGWRLEAEGRW